MTNAASPSRALYARMSRKPAQTGLVDALPARGRWGGGGGAGARGAGAGGGGGGGGPPPQKKGPAFADPALEATEGIVIWEGNYTPDTLLSEL
jgi:hypothetical protein